ncbi:MAG: DUF6640 family protein [Cyanobacteria bacterium J06626_14]
MDRFGGHPLTVNAAHLGLKIILSAVTLFYGLVPAIADMNETHLLNPLWSEHARFHGAWFLAFAAGVSGTALYLIWWADEIVIPVVLGLMFAGGFWIATVFKSTYGGALVDTNGFEHEILGFEANSVIFSGMTIILVFVLFMARSLRS